MCILPEEYTDYGWKQNAGYGAAEHIKALKEKGVTPYHRKSYAPVAKLLDEV